MKKAYTHTVPKNPTDTHRLIQIRTLIMPSKTRIFILLKGNTPNGAVNEIIYALCYLCFIFLQYDASQHII